VTFGKKEILQTITDFVFVKESPRHREQENPQLMELGKTPIKVDNLRHYLKIYPNRDDAFELGAALTTVLPVLFKYCYKYCYCDSRKL
jgi:hypothetical protein